MRYLPLICLGFPLAYLPGQLPFTEVTEAAGITVDGRGRGVSVCDFNGDGHPDLYVCLLDGPNHLYANDGTAAFRRVAPRSVVSFSGATALALWADFDGDGDEDVLLGNRDEPSLLLRNEGGSFVDATAGSGVLVNASVQTGSVLDYDGDGLPDIYLAVLGSPNRLLRNLGNLRFSEVAPPGGAGAGFSGLAMQSLAVDYDDDGDQDLYLVHDGNQPNALLRNEGGNFVDVSAVTGAGVVGDGMGADAADYDRDGDLDIYVTNLYDNFLLRNEGDGRFRESAFDAGVNDPGMGWGTAWLDYNLDGWPDLYVANETGFTIAGRRFNNILYRNAGGRFRPATDADAPINSSRGAYGTAVGDFNQDGVPDLFVVNSGQPSQLFVGQAAGGHHWIAVDLRHTYGYALGARATLHYGAQKAVAEVRSGSSYASQHERTLRFGLGPVDSIDSLVVRWPDGERRTYVGLAADRRHAIRQDRTTAAVHVTSEVELSVYPNPVSSGELSLSMPLWGIRIADASGRPVVRYSGTRRRIRLPVDLAPGMYYLSGFAEDVRVVVRVICFR